MKKGRGKEEKKGLLWDPDVDVVFIVRGISIGRRGIVASVVGKGSGRDTVRWVVEFVDSGSGVGGESGGVEAPVDDFGVCVSERASGSSGGGRVECTHVIGMEGCKRSIDIFDFARCVGVSPVSVRLGRCVGIRVDGLPDRKESVDVCMVQPEDRVKARIWDNAHVSSVSDQTVDSVVHVLEGIVRCASAVREARVGERRIVRLLGDELVS